jgi:dTDP-4-dehydrorhamnose reductase
MTVESRPLVVFGAEGQVGRALQEWAASHELPIVGLSRKQADVTNMAGLARACCRLIPAAVINAAAFTAVDGAEDNSEQAFAVNAQGAENVAVLAKYWGVPLLHLSTDYVFDGSISHPYQERDPVNPLGVYGASKLAGEQAVLSLYQRTLVCRTSCVYGLNGSNFVRSILEGARAGSALSVVNDQTGCPTLDTDLAEALLKIAETLIKSEQALNWGVLHLCGAEPATRYEWACGIMAAAAPYLESKIPVEPISTRISSCKAARPANSALSTGLARSLFEVEIPGWRAALPGMVRRFFNRSGVAEVANGVAA